MRDVDEIRQRLRTRREWYRKALETEAERLAELAGALGAERVVLFGSVARGDPGLASDLDLLIIWDTPMGFLDRTVEMYRRLEPRVAVDLLVYTPAEMEAMAQRAFAKRALAGRVMYAA